MPSATIPKVPSTAAARLGLMAMAENAQVTMKCVHLFQASKSVCLYLPKLDERIKNIDDFHKKAVYGNVEGSVGSNVSFITLCIHRCVHFITRFEFRMLPPLIKRFYEWWKTNCVGLVLVVLHYLCLEFSQVYNAFKHSYIFILQSFSGSRHARLAPFFALEDRCPSWRCVLIWFQLVYFWIGCLCHLNDKHYLTWALSVRFEYCKNWHVTG